MHYHGHRERLRARLFDAPEKLNDYEILELLLGYVILRRDTKPIAKELLQRFKTLRGVVEAKPDQYLDIPGLGKGVVGFFRLFQEIIPRYVESAVISRQELCDPESVARMARERLGKLDHEEIWIAFVDNRNRLMRFDKASHGTVGSSMLNPRDIVEHGLVYKASGFILVHNHPSGDPHPSGADIEITKRIEKAARTVFLRFIDHVIVSDSGCYSMMDEGMLIP